MPTGPTNQVPSPVPASCAGVKEALARSYRPSSRPLHAGHPFVVASVSDVFHPLAFALLPPCSCYPRWLLSSAAALSFRLQAASHKCVPGHVGYGLPRGLPSVTWWMASATAATLPKFRPATEMRPSRVRKILFCSVSTSHMAAFIPAKQCDGKRVEGTMMSQAVRGRLSGDVGMQWRGRCVTASPEVGADVLPVKANIPIWSVTCVQSCVDPAALSSTRSILRIMRILSAIAAHSE